MAAFLVTQESLRTKPRAKQTHPLALSKSHRWDSVSWLAGLKKLPAVREHSQDTGRDFSGAADGVGDPFAQERQVRQPWDS